MFGFFDANLVRSYGSSCTPQAHPKTRHPLPARNIRTLCADIIYIYGMKSARQNKIVFKSKRSLKRLLQKSTESE